MELSWNYKLQQGHSKRDISSDIARKRPKKKALTLSGKHRSAMNWFASFTHASSASKHGVGRDAMEISSRACFIMIMDHNDHGSFFDSCGFLIAQFFRF
jgi:hypothetical protein